MIKLEFDKLAAEMQVQQGDIIIHHHHNRETFITGVTSVDASQENLRI